eukprot:TRINITY_DN975_c0_g2_i2.p1 TRINITY_DN975_c0_g2~~TRINITY_DN975_c0_g2_i2.p1  ORF type:complete len:189 (+),score=45.56 TRINITY_DN975_c0_g2_i2:54-569(+)
MGGYGTAQPAFAASSSYVTMPLPTETWEAGVCDCFQDIGLCCDVCFCTCCQAGRIYDAAFEHKPDSFNVPVCLLMVGASYFFGAIATCVFSMCMRDKVRTSYGIMGDGCDDCCMSFWCAPCVMCQVHRELSKRGTPPGYICCEPSIKYSNAPLAVQPAYNPCGASQVVRYT